MTPDGSPGIAVAVATPLLASCAQQPYALAREEEAA